MVNAYVAQSDGEFKLPAIPLDKVDREFRRQIVSYETSEKPGTIIVDTKSKHLYYVLEGNKAVRYGIGVGREGFTWSGTARIAFKREWPTWTPPAPMIKRQPELAKYRSGMQPGLTNPLGAAPSISTTSAATPAIACMARRNGGRSVETCRPAASGS